MNDNKRIKKEAEIYQQGKKRGAIEELEHILKNLEFHLNNCPNVGQSFRVCLFEIVFQIKKRLKELKK